MQNQRRQLLTEVGTLQSQWKLLLGIQKLFLPEDQSPPAWQKNFLPDSAAALDNPEIRQAKQQVVISDFRIKTARSKQLPEVTLGYNNQSFVGPDIRNGADLLTRNDRFSSYLAGVNIPLFFKPYRSAVKSATFQQKAATYTLNAKQTEWMGQWQQAVSQYKQQLQSVNYYESLGLNQAAELLRTATLSFKSGGISYIEWVSFYNQSIQIQNDRLNVFMQLDQTINTIWYYQAQPQQP